MAVVIRLSRTGTKKKPFFHIVAAPKTRARDGRYLERLGYYDPKLKDESKRVRVDVDAVSSWVNKGAYVTETVGHLLKRIPQSK